MPTINLRANILIQSGAEGEEMRDDDPNQPLPNKASSMKSEPGALSIGYNNYRSVRDAKLLILVAHEAVPPFV